MRGSHSIIVLGIPLTLFAMASTVAASESPVICQSNRKIPDRGTTALRGLVVAPASELVLMLTACAGELNPMPHRYETRIAAGGNYASATDREIVGSWR